MYKTPIQELTTKLDNLALELATTRQELTSTKKELKTLLALLVGTALNQSKSAEQRTKPVETGAKEDQNLKDDSLPVAPPTKHTPTTPTTLSALSNNPHNPYAKKLKSLPPKRFDTDEKDHAGNSIFIGDTVKLLSSSRSIRFKLRGIFQKGEKVRVHGCLLGNIYFYSIGRTPREESFRIPRNLLKE